MFASPTVLMTLYVLILHLLNRESDAKPNNNSWLLQVCVPDGLIEEDKLVEIKCPYKCSSASMETLARLLLFILYDSYHFRNSKLSGGITAFV